MIAAASSSPDGTDAMFVTSMAATALVVLATTVPKSYVEYDTASVVAGGASPSSGGASVGDGMLQLAITMTSVRRTAMRRRAACDMRDPIAGDAPPKIT